MLYNILVYKYKVYKTLYYYIRIIMPSIMLEPLRL